MKNSFDGPINRLVVAKEISSEVKDVPLEFSQAEKPKRKEKRRMKNN